MKTTRDYKEIDYLTPRELNFLLDSITNLKHKLLVLLMCDCGLRVSETVSLKVADFDFKKRFLYVKSLKKRGEAQTRKIPLSDRLFRHLADYLYSFKDLQPEDYLFPNSDKSGHLQRFAVNRFLSRLRSSKNLTDKLHPHALRHTFATSLVSNSVPLENVKLMLGHKDYNTTLIYAHIPEQILKQNIEVISSRHRNIFQRLYDKYFTPPPKLINIRSDSRIMVGRAKELQQLNILISKDINVCLKGGTGAGKKLVLDSITSDKKILTLDDTSNLKKSLVYMLLYLYDNDKEAIKELLFQDFDKEQLQTKLNRESIANLCGEIKKLVEKKQYILKINELDTLTPKVIKVLTELKDHFVIITTAREIPISKADFLWNFEVIEIRNLSRSESFELIQRLSYDLEIEDFELYRTHIFEQTDGNPRAILEMVDRYRKEPFILRETIRSITHSGALREYDMSYFVVLFIASIAVFRYLSSEVENPSLRFIGGCAMVLLIFSRSFFNRTKRKFV